MSVCVLVCLFCLCLIVCLTACLLAPLIVNGRELIVCVLRCWLELLIVWFIGRGLVCLSSVRSFVCCVRVCSLFL